MEKIVEILNKIDFKCQKCSNCCRHEPGAVFLSEEDFKKIKNYLSISDDIFIEKYCRILEKNNQKVFALKEKSNYDCIFWNNGCIIYEVRPIQCQTYPFWSFLVENIELLNNEKKRCKGIGIKGEISLNEKLTYYYLEKNIKYKKVF